MYLINVTSVMDERKIARDLFQIFSAPFRNLTFSFFFSFSVKIIRRERNLFYNNLGRCMTARYSLSYCCFSSASLRLPGFITMETRGSRVREIKCSHTAERARGLARARPTREGRMHNTMTLLSTILKQC